MARQQHRTTTPLEFRLTHDKMTQQHARLQVTHFKLEKLKGQADLGCSFFRLAVPFLTVG